MNVDLLPLVAAGDPAALRACLERYSRVVWALARRHLGPGAEAEDAVQDIFVSLWRAAGRYDPARGSEITFVLVLARRRLLDARRRRSVRPATEPLESAPEPAAPDDPSGLSEEAVRAAHALAALPWEQRQPIELSIRDGCTHAEIAARLGQPLGTVKSHLRRGLLRLREALRSEPLPTDRPRRLP